MNVPFQITSRPWNISTLQNIANLDIRLSLSPRQAAKIKGHRRKLENLLRDTDQKFYGINTGFGALCNTLIDDNDLNALQTSLVRSHACGTGAFIPAHWTQWVLLLKIKSLSLGASSVRLELVNFLIDLYNKKIFPCIPEMGSLGASGDLAPLAHLGLVCIGEGAVSFQNEIYPTADLVKKGIIRPPGLQAKEGLALLNGTQYSTALLLNAAIMARKLYRAANMVAAVSIESFNASVEAFLPEIQILRNQSGQIKNAKEILRWLRGSDIHSRKKYSVQDPYSFRCIPQVHGASLDAIEYVERVLNNEINAVTDNPLLLSNGRVYSGGNFHAQPIALAADFLAIACAELASISERRIYQLISGFRDLPEFLTPHAGLHSGYMIVQYAAAALVSMNKQLCTPASVDSIISSKGQEDHVSMSANAGLKCNKVVQQCWQVLVMEWMTAVRALHYRKNYKLNPKLQDAVNAYRKLIPFIEADHAPQQQYDETFQFLYTWLG